MSSAPARLLFVRPDTYGDLILFEPVLRLVRRAFPETTLAVLIRESYLDVAPLIGGEGIQWITTACNPYTEGPRDSRAAFEALRETVQAFAPDCLVAACYERTWLEAAVATFLPQARQISLGPRDFDPMTRATLDAQLTIDWSALYREKVPVEENSRDWEKNIRLAHALISSCFGHSAKVASRHRVRSLSRIAQDLGIDHEGGSPLPEWWPTVRVPDEARSQARRAYSKLGLEASAIAVCCPAGTANVAIKSWPGEYFGESLAWLEREHGIRVLLVGHESERETLELVQRTARDGGADPAIWTGRTGEMAVAAGLLADVRFYFGNDTGILHLAAALGRPTVSIFGGGHWPRFRPLSRRSAVIVQPLPCFGCGWNCLFEYAPCVKEIPPKTVQGALKWLLASSEDAETEIVVEDAIPEIGRALIAGAVATQRDSVADGAGTRSTSPKALSALLGKLDFSETDRAARLVTIEQQGLEIVRLQGEVDRWLKETEQLWPKLNEARNARAQLDADLKALRAHFAASEADRAARLQVIDKQAAENARLGGEVDRWLKEAGALWPKLNAAENARNLLAAQHEELRAHFAASENDRAARLRVIEAQGAENTRLQGQVHRWLKEAEELGPKLNAAESAAALLAGELEAVRGNLATSESTCEKVSAKAAELQTWQATIRRHWTTRLLKNLHLWPE